MLVFWDKVNELNILTVYLILVNRWKRPGARPSIPVTKLIGSAWGFAQKRQCMLFV